MGAQSKPPSMARPSMASYAVGQTYQPPPAHQTMASIAAANLGLGGNNTPLPTPTMASMADTSMQNFDYSAVDDMLARARQQATQRYVPSIEDLFPQLAQSQYLQGEQTTQTSSEPSYGAGRFLGTTK